MTDLQTRKEELIDEWFDGQNGGCSCCVSPPCNYCVRGYGLDLDEFLAINLEGEGYDDEPQNTTQDSAVDAYDRAMKGLF